MLLSLVSIEWIATQALKWIQDSKPQLDWQIAIYDFDLKISIQNLHLEYWFLLFLTGS
jgi:hypothetical protein